MRVFFMFLEFLVALTLVTQVLIPSFTSLDFFWFFKREKPKQNVSSLDDLGQEVSQSVQQYQSTKSKVDDASKQIDSLKSKFK